MLDQFKNTLFTFSILRTAEKPSFRLATEILKSQLYYRARVDECKKRVATLG